MAALRGTVANRRRRETDRFMAFTASETRKFA